MRPVPTFLIVCAGLAAAFGQAREPVTILALGDSITAGSKSFTCYRQVLVPMLATNACPTRFMGPQHDATSAHAGFGGRNTATLRKMVSKLYQAHPADIVLLHSGHNSFAKDKPVAGILRDTEAIMAELRRINPEVTVLLGQVIPAGKLPKYSYIPELNRGLAALAERLKKEGRRVILVPHHVGFDWTKDTVADKVHPNAKGARKMAVKWFEALKPLLAPQTEPAPAAP